MALLTKCRDKIYCSLHYNKAVLSLYAQLEILDAVGR